MKRKRGQVRYSKVPEDCETAHGCDEEDLNPEDDPVLALAPCSDDDFDWGEEELTCGVCDRAFNTPWDLEKHQIKKRHWG